jgi:hypothetical protein
MGGRITRGRKFFVKKCKQLNMTTIIKVFSFIVKG